MVRTDERDIVGGACRHRARALSYSAGDSCRLRFHRHFVAAAATDRVSVPFARTSPAPLRPMIVPPRANAASEQVRTTFDTFANSTMPVPPATEQLCPLGWVATATE